MFYIKALLMLFQLNIVFAFLILMDISLVSTCK